ncbi:MAG: hypothetical protein CYG61_02245, partial [Actinobacteria bacterium]
EEPREREAAPGQDLESRPTTAESSSSGPGRAEPAPHAAGNAGREGSPPDEDREARTPVRRRRSERRISPRVSEQPPVVILSTPAVRRLDAEDERETKGSAPPS